MAGYDGRGARFDVVAVEGSDLSFTVTAVDGDAAAVDVSSATITGNVYNQDGAVLDTLNVAVSGVGNNVITLSLSDTEVDALVLPATWSLVVDRAGDARTWLAGSFLVRLPQSARNAATGTAVTATVDTDVVVTADVLTGVGPDAAIAAHNADTTDVHGITDTSALALSSDVTAEIDADIATHEAATDPHTQYAKVAGDTFTGFVTAPRFIASGDSFSALFDGSLRVTSDSGTPVEIRSSAATQALITFESPTGTIESYVGQLSNDDFRIASDGVAILNQDSSDGNNLDLSGNPSVTVPAITAANQAAQVTAYDATTGQLQIGGVEMGDTGWRDVTGDLLNGWEGRAGATTGCLIVRRRADTVEIRGRLDSTNATTSTLHSVASGFRATGPAMTIDMRWPALSANRGSTPLSARVASGSLIVCYDAGGGIDVSISGQFYTDDSWPTTLPGTAV